MWHAEPGLGEPVLVVALRGLFDIGEAATRAAQHLVSIAVQSERLAEIDPELFFNFSQVRPLVSLGPRNKREIHWPENIAHSVTAPGGQAMVVMAGIEPHLRWRSFATALVELARRSEAELIITLGATASMTPHTRPLGVVGSTSNSSLATQLGLQRPSYEGPTGVVGVLHAELEANDIPSLSLRVGVPHYVPAPPNPEATRSLLARFELITGIPTMHESLRSDARDWTRRVDAAVSDDDEMSQYVRELERQLDESADEILPSGDDLAAELEGFLRARRIEDDPHDDEDDDTA